MDSKFVIFMIWFFIILVLFILINKRIKDSKVLLIAFVVVTMLPVFAFLLLEGKIQKSELKLWGIEATITEASENKLQVEPLTGFSVETDLKLDISKIPDLIRMKTQGLVFLLGNYGYYGDAIKEYLFLLTRQPFLQYIIIENPDKTFFAMADARALANQLIDPYLYASPHYYSPYTADEFAMWLSSSNKTLLKQLPGFVSAESAVTETMDKDQALQHMKSLNVNHLPVVNKDNYFIGIVDQSRLTASLLLDVVKAFKK